MLNALGLDVTGDTGLLFKGTESRENNNANRNQLFCQWAPKETLWAAKKLTKYVFKKYHISIVFSPLPHKCNNDSSSRAHLESSKTSRGSYIYLEMAIFVMISVGDPWHFGADPDPDPRISRYLWLMDPDSTPDPTPVFNDAKKNFFIFFLITYLQAHYLQLKIKFFAKIFY
jgi:hypothetical protein